jgi:uncharacterized protein (DUF488 family)
VAAVKEQAVGLTTLGHGQLSSPELAALLAGGGLAHLVDIRRYPGSRAHPDLSRDALAEALPSAGITYRWEERLGGRRRLPPKSTSRDGWWTVEAFRAYAAHTRTAEFRAGLEQLLGQVRDGPVAIMCSESVWWRCHRRLVADVVVLVHELPVMHLMPGGALRPHRPAEGARRAGDVLYWDGDPAVPVGGSQS